MSLNDLESWLFFPSSSYMQIMHQIQRRPMKITALQPQKKPVSVINNTGLFFGTINSGTMTNVPKSTLEKALDWALDGFGLVFKLISKALDED